jgi:hypothetical protein
LPWQAFQSQLLPHDGSQKSPGHQFGPGCAWASALPPRPVKPNAAAIAADAIALLANLFMGLCVRRDAMRCPRGSYRPDEKPAAVHVWQVGHQKTLRPSNSAVRIAVPHTRHASPARR